MSSAPPKWRLNGRPILVANYGPSEEMVSPAVAGAQLPSSVSETSQHSMQSETWRNENVMDDQLVDTSTQLRYNFPEAGAEFEGGQSDGYCFSLEFGASRAGRNLEMIRAFLQEQGYGNLPIPADLQELRAFRLARKYRRQLQFFSDDGYVHNPIKILFPPPGTKGQSLRLEIYNEKSPKHLLKFHGRA